MPRCHGGGRAVPCLRRQASRESRLDSKVFNDISEKPEVFFFMELFWPGIEEISIISGLNVILQYYDEAYSYLHLTLKYRTIVS